MTGKVWFITGASRGFGRVWAQAALARGDKVAATGRDARSFAALEKRFGEDVLPLVLDVTSADQARQAVEAAHDRFGRLDVVVNNAGYTLIGTIEEAQEADIRALFETNVLGAHRVIQAALPILRRQGSGHILGVSSGLGVVTMPLMGIYSTTKWAIEALHESLAQEVAAFGVRVTLIEPGAYATDFTHPSSRRVAEGLPAYADLRSRLHAILSNRDLGDPAATAEAILKLVDSNDPPLRLALGPTVLPRARAAFAARLAEWEAWEAVSNAAQGQPTKAEVEAF